MFCTVNEFKSKVKVSDLFPSYEFSIKIYAKVHLIIIHNLKKKHASYIFTYITYFVSKFTFVSEAQNYECLSNVHQLINRILKEITSTVKFYSGYA